MFSRHIIQKSVLLISEILTMTLIHSITYHIRFKLEYVWNHIFCDLKLPACKNYMNFADMVGIYKYQHFGANNLEIGPFLLKLLRKYEVLMDQSIALKTPKICLVRDVAK